MIRISLICSFFIFSLPALGMLTEKQDTYTFLDEYQNISASDNTQNDNIETNTPKRLYVILNNVDDKELSEIREYILTGDKSAYDELIKDLQTQEKLKVFKIKNDENSPQNDNPFVVGTLGGGGVPQELIEVPNDEINDIDFYEVKLLFTNEHIEETVNLFNDTLEANDYLDLHNLPLVSGTLGGGGTAQQ